MNNNLKTILTFGAGAVIGALASYYITKSKYESILEEEIQSVKDTYKKRDAKENPEEQVKEENIKDEDTEEVKTTVNKDRAIYDTIIKESGYVNYTAYSKHPSIDEEENAPVKDPNDRPYIINEEDYGEELGYDTQTLTYFADGVLVDDVDDLVEHVDDVVGLDNLKIFEEFGASAIYVRNDYLMADYEILKDDFNFSDLKDPMSDEELEKAKEMMLNRLHERTATEKKPHQI